jgi:hypothetical protein
VGRRIDSQTRAGRVGDALLDLLYGVVLVGGGLFVGAVSWVAIAESDGDSEVYPVLAVAGLIVVGGLYYLLRAARGRSADRVDS